MRPAPNRRPHRSIHSKIVAGPSQPPHSGSQAIRAASAAPPAANAAESMIRRTGRPSQKRVLRKTGSRNRPPPVNAPPYSPFNPTRERGPIKRQHWAGAPHPHSPEADYNTDRGRAGRPREPDAPRQSAVPQNWNQNRLPTAFRQPVPTDFVAGAPQADERMFDGRPPVDRPPMNQAPPIEADCIMLRPCS